MRLPVSPLPTRFLGVAALDSEAGVVGDWAAEAELRGFATRAPSLKGAPIARGTEDAAVEGEPTEMCIGGIERMSETRTVSSGLLARGRAASKT